MKLGSQVTSNGNVHAQLCRKTPLPVQVFKTCECVCVRVTYHKLCVGVYATGCVCVSVRLRADRCVSPASSELSTRPDGREETRRPVKDTGWLSLVPEPLPVRAQFSGSLGEVPCRTKTACGNSPPPPITTFCNAPNEEYNIKSPIWLESSLISSTQRSKIELHGSKTRCHILLPLLKFIQHAKARAASVCVCVLEESSLPSFLTWSVCLCTLSLRKMRCVNPNVREAEAISDSAEHHVPRFFFSSSKCIFSFFTFFSFSSHLAHWTQRWRLHIRGRGEKRSNH